MSTYEKKTFVVTDLILFVWALVVSVYGIFGGRKHVVNRSVQNKRTSRIRYYRNNVVANCQTRNVIRLPKPVSSSQTAQTHPATKEKSRFIRGGSQILPPYQNMPGLSLVKGKLLTPLQVACLKEMGVPGDWIG